MPNLDSYRVDLPAEWTSVPIDTVDTFHKMFVEFRNDEEWALFSRTEQRRAELAVKQLDAFLEQGGCDLAAFFFSPDDAGETEGGGPTAVFGALTLSTLTAAQLGAPGRITVDLLLSAMMQPSTEDSSRLLEPPSRVELPVGPAVRLMRVLSYGRGADAKLFNASCMVPIEPELDAVCVMTLSSPNIELARDFEALFDAIAQTLKFYREGDPTEL